MAKKTTTPKNSLKTARRAATRELSQAPGLRLPPIAPPTRAAWRKAEQTAEPAPPAALAPPAPPSADLAAARTSAAKQAWATRRADPNSRWNQNAAARAATRAARPAALAPPPPPAPPAALAPPPAKRAAPPAKRAKR